MKVEFPVAPPPGFVVLYDGQRYVAGGERRHTKADGSVATMAIWFSECPVCGEHFEAATTKLFQPNRRCKDHARPGRRVNSRSR